MYKVSRYSNGHKYPKQKQRTPNLTSFAQIGLAIVKHRILHVLRDASLLRSLIAGARYSPHSRDADAMSHVKTGEINADVLIADVIKKCNF